MANDDQSVLPQIPVCRYCGSAEINQDAWAVWNVESQVWQLGTTFDTAECRTCGAEMKWLTWLSVPVYRTRQIAQLNDKLRQGVPGPHDTIVMTAGVAALGQDTVAQLAHALATFDSFSDDDDPYQEHDFGVLTVGAVKCYFKIDYYNLERDGASPDPSDPSVTARVLTLMLASEY